MFKLFKRRAFGNEVITGVEKLLVSTLGREKGGECAVVFAETNRHFIANGDLNLNKLWDRYMDAGIPVDDCSLMMLDGTVTTLKKFQIDGGPEELKGFINLMEQAIDHRMKTNPGRVLPRNGGFANAAKESGLDKFFK